MRVAGLPWWNGRMMSENKGEVKKEEKGVNPIVHPRNGVSAANPRGNFSVVFEGIGGCRNYPWPAGPGGVILAMRLASLQMRRFVRVIMKMNGKEVVGLGLLLLLAASAGRAPLHAATGAGQDPGEESTARLTQRPEDGRGAPIFGKITAINKGSFELAKPDGTTQTVKLTDKTEFRKDRQAAKPADFKVGDVVIVRGEENADHSVTAQTIGGRSVSGAQGGRGFGEMGKDFVAGEVKSVDAPNLTILRSDKVTQTLELNEETSLRRGRESITMADIQPGDHVVVRGAVENNAFVPKNVMVLSPEQWKQMEEMRKMAGMSADGNAPVRNTPASAPKSNPPQK